MIVNNEYFKRRKDGKNLVRTYSNAGFQIQKIGTDEIYIDGQAIDLEGHPFKYIETDKPIIKNEQ